MSAPILVDARGHKCPTPSLRLRKAIKAGPAGATYLLLATDPMARIDVPYLMEELGGTVTSIVTVAGVLRITVETPAGPTD